MNSNEKLDAILAAVQVDVGNRGLAKDPQDNLFTATPGDFKAACRSLAFEPKPSVLALTGFIIPSVEPPLQETDGPLGTIFMARSFLQLRIPIHPASDEKCYTALLAGLRASEITEDQLILAPGGRNPMWGAWVIQHLAKSSKFTHFISIERAGPALDDCFYTMRGHNITGLMSRLHLLFAPSFLAQEPMRTIGIGDGGNEIGMGKIPHETIVKNIPNGDLIHCRTPTDHLIVAGVSNWGAYALAAGVFVLRGKKPRKGLFDPDNERRILEAMVREGPLVDGVTGQQTATVDGLSWDEYAKPLIEIGRILEQ